MQQTAVARLFNERTGDIVLRGVGNKRLSQALAAGLITDVLRGDVEAVQSENNGLKTALGEAKQEAQRESAQGPRRSGEKSSTDTCAIRKCRKTGARSERSLADFAGLESPLARLSFLWSQLSCCRRGLWRFARWSFRKSKGAGRWESGPPF